MSTAQRKTALAGAAGTARMQYSNTTTSLSSIEQALTFIDPHNRDTWIDSGMTVNSEVGDSGFDSWNRCGANANHYDPRALLASRKSFSTDGVIMPTILFI